MKVLVEEEEKILTKIDFKCILEFQLIFLFVGYLFLKMVFTCLSKGLPKFLEIINNLFT